MDGSADGSRELRMPLEVDVSWICESGNRGRIPITASKGTATRAERTCDARGPVIASSIISRILIRAPQLGPKNAPRVFPDGPEDGEEEGRGKK